MYTLDLSTAICATLTKGGRSIMDEAITTELSKYSWERWMQWQKHTSVPQDKEFGDLSGIVRTLV